MLDTAIILTVTDAHGCTASSAEPLANQDKPYNVTVVNATCNGTSTGSVTSRTTGGTGSYSYDWSNNATSQNTSNVIAGTYSVTVKDANQCTATASASVSQPAAISVNATIHDVSCNGGNNGSISTIVSGGNGSYTYNWSNSALTGTINNLAADNYSVTVKDVSNCSTSFSTAITQPSVISVIATARNSSCNGGNTGV